MVDLQIHIEALMLKKRKLLHCTESGALALLWMNELLERHKPYFSPVEMTNSLSFERGQTHDLLSRFEKTGIITKKNSGKNIRVIITDKEYVRNIKESAESTLNKKEGETQ